MNKENLEETGKEQVGELQQDKTRVSPLVSTGKNDTTHASDKLCQMRLLNSVAGTLYPMPADAIVKISSGASHAETLIRVMLSDAIPTMSLGQLLIMSSSAPDSLISGINISSGEIMLYDAIVNAMQRWSSIYSDSGLALYSNGGGNDGATVGDGRGVFPLLAPEVLVSMVLATPSNMDSAQGKLIHSVIRRLATIAASTDRSLKVVEIRDLYKVASSDGDLNDMLKALALSLSTNHYGHATPLTPDDLVRAICTVIEMNVSEMIALKGEYSPTGLVGKDVWDYVANNSFDLSDWTKGTRALNKSKSGSTIPDTVLKEIDRHFASREIGPLVKQIQTVAVTKRVLNRFVFDSYKVLESSYESSPALMRVFADLCKVVSEALDENVASTAIDSFQSQTAFTDSFAGVLHTLSNSGRAFSDANLQKALALLDDNAVQEAWNNTSFKSFATMTVGSGESTIKTAREVTQGREFHMTVNRNISAFTYTGQDVIIDSDFDRYMSSQSVNDEPDPIAKMFYSLLAYRCICSNKIKDGVRKGAYTSITGPWNFSTAVKDKVNVRMSSIASAVSVDLACRVQASRIAILYRALLVKDGYDAISKFNYFDAFATQIVSMVENIEDFRGDVLDAIEKFIDQACLTSLWSKIKDDVDVNSIPNVPFSRQEDGASKELMDIARYRKSMTIITSKLCSLLSRKPIRTRVIEAITSAKTLYCQTHSEQSVADTCNPFELDATALKQAISDVIFINNSDLGIMTRTGTHTITDADVLREYLNSFGFNINGTVRIGMMLPLSRFETGTDSDMYKHLSAALITDHSSSANIAKIITSRVAEERMKSCQKVTRDTKWTVRRFSDLIGQYGSGAYAMLRICPDPFELSAYGMSPDRVTVQMASSTSDIDDILSQFGTSSKDYVTRRGASIITALVVANEGNINFPFAPKAFDIESQERINLGDILKLKKQYTDAERRFGESILYLRTPEMLDFLMSDSVITQGSVLAELVAISPVQGIRIPENSNLILSGEWEFKSAHSNLISNAVAFNFLSYILKDITIFLNGGKC